jgi:hypothetical protein
MCQFLSAIGADDLVAIGDLDDGTPVYQNSHIGGLAVWARRRRTR